MANLDFLLSIAAQIPLVVLFIWFVLQRDKESNRKSEARSELWRKFFNQLQSQNTEALKKITIAIEAMTKQINLNTTTVLLHDTTVRGTNPETIGTSEELIKRLMGKQ